MGRRRVWRRREPVPPLFLTIAVAILVAAGCIRGIECRLYPTLGALADTQVKNQITAWLEQAVARDLSNEEPKYSDLVTIQRDESGAITALTANTLALNRLRANLLEQLLADLSSQSEMMVKIPLGSLINSDFTWGRGPKLAFSATFSGTVSAEFESEFTASGVNQTIHRIDLTLNVPVTVFLSGGRREVSAELRIPIAETVIVGRIPENYFRLPVSG